MGKPSRNHVKLAASLCINKRCAVDGGAHTGQVTALMLELGFELVVAIEPGPAFNKLHAKFHEVGNTMLLNAALGHIHNRMVWFGGATPSTTPKLWYADASRRGSVRMVRLDDVMPRHIPIDLVKLDLEGGELNALHGMRDTLTMHRPVVTCETSELIVRHNDGVGRRALFNYMDSLGYIEVAGNFVGDTVWRFP